MSGFPPNFSPSEFRCKCAGKHCDGNSLQPDRVRHLAWTLQAIRNEIGFPIRINSAYRCPGHNRDVGGAPQSLHLQSYAADLDVMGVEPRRAESMSDLLTAENLAYNVGSAGGVLADIVTLGTVSGTGPFSGEREDNISGRNLRAQNLRARQEAAENRANRRAEEGFIPK